MSGRSPRTDSHRPAEVSPAGSPARLLLMLGEVPYGVTPMRSECEGHASVRLRKGDGEEYLIRRDALAVITCSCPANRFRPELGPCKHIRALVDVRLIEAPGEVTVEAG